ncbi:hypothetical protein BC829DRAFT_419486 [Chytridium lagenaria]|nr:hypothetical protein BC829DRAFT_419486 [Chytridium lagenaria]
MSRYNTPAALAQAVAAAKTLPVDRSGEVWRIEIVTKDRFTVLSSSDSDGLIRTNITIPSLHRPTASLLLDLLLQASLLPISNQPKRRPRSIALQCTRNPEGLHVPDPRFPSIGAIFLVPLSSIAELEELMRHYELTVRIRVSMRADEEQQERERKTMKRTSQMMDPSPELSWAGADEPLSPPPSDMRARPRKSQLDSVFAQHVQSAGNSGVQSRRSSMGSEWWDGASKCQRWMR